MVRTTSHHSSPNSTTTLLSTTLCVSNRQPHQKCLQLHPSQLVEPSSLVQLFFHAPRPSADSLVPRKLRRLACPKLASAIPSFTYVPLYAGRDQWEYAGLIMSTDSSRCHVRCFHARWMVILPGLSFHSSYDASNAIALSLLNCKITHPMENTDKNSERQLTRQQVLRPQAHLRNLRKQRPHRRIRHALGGRERRQSLQIPVPPSRRQEPASPQRSQRFEHCYCA